METVKEAVQTIAPNITLEWVHDGQIAVFTIRTVARDSFALWFQAMTKIMDEWPVDRPLLCVQDNGYKEAAFTPAIRDFSKRISSYRPELAFHTALVLPRTLVTQFVELFLRTTRRPGLEVRIFFTVEDAIAWLLTKV